MKEKRLNRGKMILCLIIAVMCMILMLANEAQAEDKDIVVEMHLPTCEQNGYTLYQNRQTGAYYAANQSPALGHRWTSWETDESGSARRCQACGAEDRFPVPVLEGIAHLIMTGSMEGIGKKSQVPLALRFVNDDVTFTGNSMTSYQGHSTLLLNKHNYTIRLYEDATFANKHKTRFYNWHAEHKYILKANYWDESQCRNLVCAELWGNVASTRAHLDEHLRDLPNCGAVDGFPTAVWLNEDFLGLFTMNLHKDNDLYGMQKDMRHAIMILNAQTKPESLFRDVSEFDEKESDWELEYCGTKDTSWAKEGLNELIRFVMDSSDEEFRARLHEYLDVDAAVDYLLFIYATGLVESGAKNLVLVNFGERWIPTIYDMDETASQRS